MTWFGTLLHQLKIAKQVKEGVTTRNPVRQEHTLHHQPQLVVTYTRVQRADFPNGIHDAHHTQDVFLVMLEILIISLFASAKQAASVFDGKVFSLAQAVYRLAPAFFLTGMPCSSAMSISTFRA